MIIRAARALIGSHIVGPIQIEIRDGCIVGLTIRENISQSVIPDIDLINHVLTPGLVDLQINGGWGVDFAQMSEEQFGDVLRRLAQRGVTSLQPTLITAPLADMVSAIEWIHNFRQNLAEDTSARILGVHCEGPFLSPVRKGVHDPRHMCEPTPEAVAELVSSEASRAILTTVTLAPELPQGISAIESLVDSGVIVSIGHSNATAEQVAAAADAGARMATHIFNSQSPMTQRDPGVPGALLTDDRFFIGAIIDTHHVDTRVLEIVRRCALSRMFGVSDGIVTAGLDKGERAMFGGAYVANDECGVGRRMDGVLAGAGIFLDECVRRMIAHDWDPGEVLHACTETAADAIGREDLGRLVVGARADLVAWDDGWNADAVWIGGNQVAMAS